MEIALFLFFITLLYLLGKKFLYTPAACYLYLNFLALLWYYKGIFVGYSEVVLRNKANLHLALLPEVSYFYAATFLACFLSLWGLHKPERKSIQFNFHLSYEEKFRQIFYKKQSLYLFFLISIFLTFIMLWHLNQIDLHTLWKNNSYLKISNPEGIGIRSPMLQLFHTSLGIIGLISFTFFALSIRNNLYVPALIFLLFGTYAWVFKLAGNSRWAAVMILAMIPFLYNTKKIKCLILCGVTLMIGMIAYKMVLFGRGQYDQGLIAVAANFEQVYGKILNEGLISPDFLEFFFSNVLAGAKDLALAIQKGPLSYPEEYKILSFSPLLSAIDGYDHIRTLYQHKITSYMPFNFYAELYFFGWKYWTFAFFIYTLGLRILNSAALKYGIMGYLLAIPGLFCFFVMQQYSIRTCFRYFLISIVLALIFDHYQKRKLIQPSVEKRNEPLKTIHHHAA